MFVVVALVVVIVVLVVVAVIPLCVRDGNCWVVAGACPRVTVSLCMMVVGVVVVAVVCVYESVVVAACCCKCGCCWLPWLSLLLGLSPLLR